MGVTSLVKFARVASLETAASSGRPRGPAVTEVGDAAAALVPDKVDVAVAPLHLFCADMVSRLAVEDGTVLDIGCASGRMAIILASGRPDLRVVGADDARRGLLAGRDLVRDAGLGERVDLRADDVTDLAASPKQIDVICCSLLLHELADRGAVHRCLTGIVRLRKEHGCAVWIMDLARLKRAETMAAVLGHELGVPPRRRPAGLAREEASWSVEELGQMLEGTGLRALQPATDKSVGFLQVWWVARSDGAPVDHAGVWYNPRVGRRAAMSAARLRATVEGVPA